MSYELYFRCRPTHSCLQALFLLMCSSVFLFQRFSHVKEVSPPVGIYNDPRCALELLKKTTGVKKIPFGITSVRFNHDQKKSSIPGNTRIHPRTSVLQGPLLARAKRSCDVIVLSHICVLPIHMEMVTRHF